MAVDGVLLDYRLPDVLGIDLCRELLVTLGPDMAILLATADCELTLETRVYASGATAFLLKPFEPDVLLTLLTAYEPTPIMRHSRDMRTASGTLARPASESPSIWTVCTRCSNRQPPDAAVPRGYAVHL